MAPDPPPLPTDVVDELLSAELDGELDAAARDHGMSVDEAQAALAATPGTDARRAALARAQTASAGDAVTLDAVTRERLVRAVRPRDLVPATPRRDVPWARVIAIAASVAIVAGLVGITARGLGKSSSTANKSSGTTAAAAPEFGTAAPTVSLGALDSDADLERMVRRFAPGSQQDASRADNGNTSGAVVAPSTTATAPTASPPRPSAGGRGAAGSQCLAHLPPAAAQGAHIVGYATHDGRVVAVAIAGGAGGPYAWAFDPASCAIVLAAAGI
jgi:hypothetical protein